MKRLLAALLITTAAGIASASDARTLATSPGGDATPASTATDHVARTPTTTDEARALAGASKDDAHAVSAGARHADARAMPCACRKAE